MEAKEWVGEFSIKNKKLVSFDEMSLAEPRYNNWLGLLFWRQWMEELLNAF